MKKSIALFSVLILLVTLLSVGYSCASADMGPKPSVRITFKNVTEPFYATLLSETETTGPATAYLDNGRYEKQYNWYLPNGDADYYSCDSFSDEPFPNAVAEDIWQKFQNIGSEDGFYFLQMWWQIEGDDNVLNWGYFPPDVFKVAFYFPESNIVVVSETCKSYAFDSYFTVDMQHVSATDGTVRPIPQPSYDYLGEILGLLFRIALTILIELCIALLFRIRGGRAVAVIIITNAVTQILLNVFLNLIEYFQGIFLVLFAFIPLELLVFAIEATVYGIALRKQGVPIWKSVLYAFTANFVSAVAGFGFALLFPTTF